MPYDLEDFYNKEREKAHKNRERISRELYPNQNIKKEEHVGGEH